MAGRGSDDPVARTDADVADFERFVAQHAGDVSRFAFLLTGDSHEADDLTGDVLLAAWQQWPAVRSATRPLAYLRGMTANMAASRVRRRMRWRAILPRLEVDARESVRGPDGLDVDVRDALARLPPGRRACVVLRLAFDLSEQDVADILKVSPGTVKNQTWKAVRTLRGLLGEREEHLSGDLRRALADSPWPRVATRPDSERGGTRT